MTREPPDPDLYECADCSTNPGSPTLCRRCLNARRYAGAEWRGPLPNERTSPSECLVSSITVETIGAHDVVSIWSRGALAGALTVQLGDGLEIAKRLSAAFDLESDAPPKQVFVAANGRTSS